VAKVIAQDEIDILFDMSGFTKGERLEIFKHKPAPLQVAYLGYFGTVGMKEMDYLVADECTVPAEEDQFYTERVYKFKDYGYHSSLYAIPEPIAEPPCIANGYITLGSLNTFHKISATVLDTWIAILKQIPNSKLLFDSRHMISVTDQQFFVDLFVRSGIARERLIFRATLDREEFLQCYNQIDIALDPFPYTGATTTLESFLMGVPLVTLFGNKFAGRFSSSILKTIGHEELIAYNVDEYQNKIIALAHDQERLKHYRNTLKTDVHESPMHIDRYIVRFNKALIEMWQSKC
jgi:predicted O-linked N-acetylglucosamine transferase (SPINDLY family)